MQILKRTVVGAALLFAATSAASAQTKAPDFSGHWEMNAAKSDLGPMAAMLQKVAFDVQQTPTTFTFTQQVTTPQGSQTTPAQQFTLDGKETTETIPTGQTIVKSATLAGDTLVLVGKLQGGEQGTTGRWTLSPDGKSLMVDQHMAGPMGAMTMKLLFDKK